MLPQRLDETKQKGGTVFHDQKNPKCANPACPVAFEWMAGGKFFRFHPPGNGPAGGPGTGEPLNAHGVKHYWLCERCARIYTLAYSEDSGVVVRPLMLELAVAPNPKGLVAA